MKTHLVIASSVLALGLAACAPAKQPLIVYQCDDGTGLSTRIISGEYIAVQREGKVYSMQQKIAASGVRYQGEGYEWWGKGNEGTFAPIGVKQGLTCRTGGDRS